MTEQDKSKINVGAKPGVKSKVQGEGDYEAARRYRNQAEAFVDSGRVDAAADRAKPRSAQERAEMEAAEQEGLRHSKATGK